MAEKQQILRIDGVKWCITSAPNGTRLAVPLCPLHNLRLDPKPEKYYSSRLQTRTTRPEFTAKELECAEGQHILNIPREFGEEQKYIINRVDALIFKEMTVLNLDDEAIPVASYELKKDTPYWVKAKITESKSGIRLIVWAGDRLRKNKTQLFVEPEIKRLSFDQNDDHPTEIFAKIEATFSENVTAIISKKKE